MDITGIVRSEWFDFCLMAAFLIPASILDIKKKRYLIKLLIPD